MEELLGKKHPEKKFKAGAVSATIWKNETTNSKGEKSFFMTVSLERNYLDKDGNWKSTNVLRTGDLPKAVLVLNKAYEFLMLGKDSGFEEL